MGKSLKLWLVDNPRGSAMVFMYRVANFASRAKKRSVAHMIWAAPILIGYRFLTEIVFGYELPAATRIGPNLMIDHGYAIVVNKHARFGKDCRIKHGITVGCQTMADGSQGPSPSIGDRVDIGAYAILIGGITIGNDVRIAAGAVVTRSVPCGAVVRGQVAECYLD